MNHQILFGRTYYQYKYFVFSLLLVIVVAGYSRASHANTPGAEPPTPPQQPAPPSSPDPVQEESPTPAVNSLVNAPNDQPDADPTLDENAIQEEKSQDNSASVLPKVQGTAADTSDDEWFKQVLAGQNDATESNQIDPVASPDATDASSLNAPADTPSSPLERSYLILIVGTALIMLIGWGITAYYKRHQTYEGKPMRHLHTLRLGQKHHISMIEVFDKTLVLGLSDGNVTLLSEIPSSTLAAYQSPQADPEHPATPSPAASARWQDLFQEAIKRSPQDDMQPPATTPHTNSGSGIHAYGTGHSPSPVTNTVHDGLFSSFEQQPSTAKGSSTSSSNSRPMAASTRQSVGDTRSNSVVGNRHASGLNPQYKTSGNRESDSVLIGLQALKNKGSTG